MGMVRSLKALHGAILLELLLSMTLFMVALLPLTRFLIRTTGADRAADIFMASHLARQHLEALRQAPTTPTTPEPATVNNRSYRITQDVVETNGRYIFTVRVYRGSEQQPLMELTTRVYKTDGEIRR